MPDEIRIWQVAKDDTLVEVARRKLELENRVQKWISRDISVLSQDLLVLGQQVPTAFGTFIDILCINPLGHLVIVELKRDKTPREVVAQALDYAAWVQDLGVEQIEALAAKRLNGGTLREAFKQRYDLDLPDVVNEHHSMLIVASEIDDSTERIIRYLSETHAVDINAVVFQFHESADSREFLIRRFTVAPSEAEQNIRKGPSKSTNPTPEEMQQAAVRAGVGELYSRLQAGIGNHLHAYCFKTTRAFYGKFGGKERAILSLIPQESSANKGVRFTVYSKRLSEYLGVEESRIIDHLPSSREPYKYYKDAPADLTGWAGYIKDASEAENLLAIFEQSRAAGV